MENQDERWRSLCERAGNEQGLERRIELVREINRMLIDWLLEQLEQKDRLNLIRPDRSANSPCLNRAFSAVACLSVSVTDAVFDTR